MPEKAKPKAEWSEAKTLIYERGLRVAAQEAIQRLLAGIANASDTEALAEAVRFATEVHAGLKAKNARVKKAAA